MIEGKAELAHVLRTDEFAEALVADGLVYDGPGGIAPVTAVLQTDGYLSVLPAACEPPAVDGHLGRGEELHLNAEGGGGICYY